MEEYEATFEITSKHDAYAVERILTRLYDSLREESVTVREETNDATEMLEQFATLRDAARNPTPGTLIVVYEQQGEAFET